MEKELFLMNSYQTICETFIEEINENKVILHEAVFTQVVEDNLLTQGF
ncbi:hypothetical protein ACQKGA_18845 [Priestia megaterium]